MSAFASSLRPLMRTATGGALSARSFSSSSSRSVARMIITGRLAAAPELQATSSGQDVIRYTVATSTGARDNRQTSWFKVASFDQGAQRDYVLSLQKGTLVYLEGSASLRDWEDAEGKKQTTLNIVQREIPVQDELNLSDYANFRVTHHYSGNIEVLKRPTNPNENESA
ncbi:ssDNA binding protein [Aspergillus bombycis]|uniref:SsDNA binding protein n=1 Tax=Aspergillus bombycis TaxID=109264 RepID=A0A1F7ZT08_9EURO|nr:ssDNA binding protein [Aspergillus bombycis]OGM42593.1 ssDNA binding protein [Aspergillus bombycis]